MRFSESFQSTVEQLRDSAHVRTVYGDPVERDDRTVVPIARVAYGFGGGVGEDDRDGGVGGGFGGGVVATPVGALEIADGETRFVHYDANRNIARGLVAGAALGVVAAGLFAARLVAHDDQQNEDVADEPIRVRIDG
ncbi:GerW family sporulation protein [Haloarchaeobius sp. DFWS5]|uniref:GerW family sporulation protein n=1 Tax=Haloarchaeobius sp. DFWS5 TaxID=3446114 RepID=UPI003EB8C1A9